MKLSAKMRERREALRAELDALVATAEARDDKAFTEDESAAFDAKLEEIRKADERIEELEAREAAEAKAAEARKAAGEGDEKRAVGGATVTDPEVYAKGNGRSFMRDMGYRSLQGAGAHEAMERLVRHARQMADEQRALGNTNAAGGSGGEFAPPAWLVDEYIELVRPGRVTTELYSHNAVPSGVSSISIPKVTGGTAIGVQGTQNTALTSQDMTTSFVSTGFTTLGGTQVISQQLLDQSAIDFDRVILKDLAAEYAKQVGINTLSGAGTGANNNAVVNGLLSAPIPAANAVAWTEATPSVKGFYGAIAQAINAVESGRLMPPTAIVMHPRRYWWLASKSDGNGRPLLVPSAQAMNAIGVGGPNPSAPGFKGFELLGLPVYTDPNIPTNVGAGTNQDTIILAKFDDLEWYESPLQVEAFREPFASSVGVLFRAYSYVGAIVNRHLESIATVTGTGAVTPSFG